MSFYEQAKVLLDKLETVNTRLRAAQQRVDDTATRYGALARELGEQFYAGQISFDTYLRRSNRMTRRFERELARIKL